MSSHTDEFWLNETDLSVDNYIYIYIYGEGCPLGVMVKAMDSGIYIDMRDTAGEAGTNS